MGGVSPIVIVLVLFLLMSSKKDAVPPAPKPGQYPPGYRPGGYNNQLVDPGTAAAAGSFIKSLIGSGGAGSAGTGGSSSFAPYAPGANAPGPYAPNYGSSSFTPYAPGASSPGPYAPSTGDGLMPLSDASTSADIPTGDTFYA